MAIKLRTVYTSKFSFITHRNAASRGGCAAGFPSCPSSEPELGLHGAKEFEIVREVARG